VGLVVLATGVVGEALGCGAAGSEAQLGGAVGSAWLSSNIANGAHCSQYLGAILGGL